jgi:hypothetical protein
MYKNAEPSEFVVSKRYSHFELLRRQLTLAYPSISLPALPEKNFFGILHLFLSLSSSSSVLSCFKSHNFPLSLSLFFFLFSSLSAGMLTPAVVQQRVTKFNDFLQVISDHPTLCGSPEVLSFLEIAEGLGVQVENLPDPDPSLMRVRR